MLNTMYIVNRNAPTASFSGLSVEEIDVHIRIKKYGSFTLPWGISPSYDLQVIPRAGFQERWYNPCGANGTPVLLISASREAIFNLFLDLAGFLGKTVDTILETSHRRIDSDNRHRRLDGQHIDIVAEDSDLPVLLSALTDFEELLVDDGCTGIAIADLKKHIELQFDEHKMLFFHGWSKFRRKILSLMSEYKIPQIPAEKQKCFVVDAEHAHSTHRRFAEEFEALKIRLGAN